LLKNGVKNQRKRRFSTKKIIGYLSRYSSNMNINISNTTSWKHEIDSSSICLWIV